MNRRMCALIGKAVKSMSGNKLPWKFDSDSTHICVKTGASCSVFNDPGPFLSMKRTENIKISGIAQGLQVQGISTVKTRIHHDIGDHINFYIKNSLYVPETPMNLLSPQQFSQ